MNLTGREFEHGDFKPANLVKHHILITLKKMENKQNKDIFAYGPWFQHRPLPRLPLAQQNRATPAGARNTRLDQYRVSSQFPCHPYQILPQKNPNRLPSQRRRKFRLKYRRSRGRELNRRGAARGRTRPSSLVSCQFSSAPGILRRKKVTEPPPRPLSLTLALAPYPVSLLFAAALPAVAG